MSSNNAWANPTIAGAEDAHQMASFLEERSRTPDLQRINQEFCAIVAARPGEKLIEVGSGSGVMCRLLSSFLTPGGYIIGVDISAEMLFTASHNAHLGGCRPETLFVNGTAENLPFSRANFDTAIAARTLLHVSRPETVINEMKRVVRPGGKLAVMDWDFDTVTVDHPDRALTRRILHWRCDHHGGNNWSGRQLWRLMKSAGLQDCSIYPRVSIAKAEGDGLTQSLWRAAQVACTGKAISPAEQEAWQNELKRTLKDGTFFASIVYFIVLGLVPSEW